MPFNDTAPQLNALLPDTAREMELSQRNNQVASKRYSFIPEHFQRPSSPIRRYMETNLVYPGVPGAKARPGRRKAFMQALISGQAITQFDRPSSKAVGKIKALFREVRSRL